MIERIQNMFTTVADLGDWMVLTVFLIGFLFGGIMFGVSMAIMGKCPGTGPISIAEGHVDTMVGAFGGLIGGLVFTIYYDDIFTGIMGKDLGNPNIDSLIDGSNPLSIIIFGTALIIISILIPKKEMEDEMYSGTLNDSTKA